MKRLFAQLFALGLAASAAMPSAYASDNFANKGQIEVGGTIGFSNSTRVTAGNTGESTSTLDLSPFVGYFVIDQLEIGINLPLTSTSSTKSSSTDYRIILSPAWNFKIDNSTVTPALAALIGYGSTNSGGSSASGPSYGARGTVKILVAPQSLLHVGVEYLLNTRNPSGYSGGRNGNNVVNFEAGFSLVFN